MLPLVDTNGSVEKLTLFLPGLTLLQSPRTKYSIAWLEIFRHVTRHSHKWRTSMTLPKTSHPCDVIQEDSQNCTFQVNINGSTTLQLHHQLPSSFCWSESQGEEDINIIANHDPRMNRTKPKYRAMLGVVGTWSTPCDFLQLFVVYLVCSWWCLQLLGVFLECVLLPCDCVCFGLLALKTFLCVKEPWLGNLPLLCVPSYLFMSTQVA
jgi:hypothetical protein